MRLRRFRFMRQSIDDLSPVCVSILLASCNSSQNSGRSAYLKQSGNTQLIHEMSHEEALLHIKKIARTYGIDHENMDMIEDMWYGESFWKAFYLEVVAILKAAKID